MSQASDILHTVEKNSVYIMAHAKQFYIAKTMGFANQQMIGNWAALVNSTAELSADAHALYNWASKDAQYWMDNTALKYSGYKYQDMLLFLQKVIGLAASGQYEDAQNLWESYVAYVEPDMPAGSQAEVSGLVIAPILIIAGIIVALGVLAAAVAITQEIAKATSDIMASKYHLKNVELSFEAQKTISAAVDTCNQNVANAAKSGATEKVQLAMAANCKQVGQVASDNVMKSTSSSPAELNALVKLKQSESPQGFFDKIYDTLGTVGTVAAIGGVAYVTFKWIIPALKGGSKGE